MTAATRRRMVFGAIASACAPWPLAGRAAPRAKTKVDPNKKLHRLGVLCFGESISYFWDQLRALGYEEHRNLEIVFKDVDATADLAGMAAALAAADVDVIVACGNAAAIAAMRATSRTPIVLLYGAAPVEAGIVASLARPGGNVTGSAAISTELAGKSVEIFRSAVPALQRVAAIVNLDDPVGRILHATSERAARELGLTLTAWPVADDAALAKTFAAIARARPDGLLVNLSVVPHLEQIIDFAARERLPAMYPVAPAVVKGGLLSYSPHWLPQSKRNAEIVDRILHGALVRDIPMQQPVDYVLGVNLKTARAMGLAIPPPLLLRATLVIE
jgi:putative ABC transport system substrate-binding protein